MTTFETVRSLCIERGISINDLENALSYSKNTLYRLKTQNPGADKLEAIADYFDVSTDYLLGRTDKKRHSNLTEKDEKYIAKRLEDFKRDLTSSDGLNFSGEPMSDDAKESLIEAMDHIFRQTQRINKKYIPKKRRTDED